MAEEKKVTASSTAENTTESTESTATNNTLTEQNPADSVISVGDTAQVSTDNLEETLASYSDLQKSLMDLDNAAATTRSIVSTAKASVPDVSVDTINHVDTTYQKELIDQLTQAQKDQVNNSIDNTVNTETLELQRALADAQDTYKTELEQIDLAEQQALDNQVLYAKSRGDNGGIGQAQYGAIQNTAAVNRQTVKSEQTKLATDTARQISDLRAQGEFERADKLLTVTQNYLSQLIDLEQYAQQLNLSIDEFNAQLKEWEAEYKMSVSQYLVNTELSAAQMTGAFSSGTPTLSNLQNMNSQLTQLAGTLLDAGIGLTEEQYKALGLTEEQYNAYYEYLHPSSSSSSSGSGGAGDYSNWYRFYSESDKTWNQYSPDAIKPGQAVTEENAKANASLVGTGYSTVEEYSPNE